MIALILSYLAALIGSLMFLMYHINLWKYPIYYSAPLILAVYLPVSITILLPLDYVSHNAGAIGGFLLSDKSILLMWKGTYWSTFLLTWIFLPVLQEFYRVGNYLKISKLKASLKRNARFQAIMLVCSVACAVYLILEVGLTFKNLKSMIIALSHIYALVLALWLMAHGMIAIPRSLWIEGNLLQDLNHNYLRVPRLVDALEDTKSEFKEDILQVMILKENFTDPTTSADIQYRDWILSLDSQIPEDIGDLVRRQYVYSEALAINREQLNDLFMSNLTYNFQTHFYKLLAHSSEYDTILRRIVKLQKLIDAKCTPNWNDRLSIIESLEPIFPPKFEYYFQCFVVPVLSRLQSIMIYLLSFIIIESEFFHSTELSLINIIAYKMGIFKHNLTQAICLLLFFMFMLFCSVNSLARLKIFNMYHLVPRDSDPVSACFYGSYIARMTIPLSYNFVALFTSRSSIFEEWYGQSIHLAGLFNLMNNWIPRLLLIPIILTTFNLYDKIKSKIGLRSDIHGWAEFDDTDFDERPSNQDQMQTRKRDLIIVEAKRLVSMELNRRKNRDYHPRRFQPDESRARLDRVDQANAGDSEAEHLGDVTNFYHDDENSESPAPPPFWYRLGDAVSGFKNTIGSKFDRIVPPRNQSLQYHDYDTDAEEHLVV